ncbi:MAG: hypothetical protein ACFB02_20155 [Mastigocoleus sp.]
MRKSIFTTAFLIGSLFIFGCNNVKTDSTDTSNQTPRDNSEVVSVNQESLEKSSEDNKSKKDADTQKKAPVKTGNKSPKPGVGQPQAGTIKSVVQGDLLCYVTLIDEQKKEQNLGANFDICAEDKKFLNKKVKLSYEIANVNDCQSNEPCGKTKKESIISKIDIIGDSEESKKSAGDTVTLSNGEWTVKLSNYDSWNGINGTGNVKYYGCDAKGKCINLTGGKVFCRNGKCVTGWENGDYTYAIEDMILEKANDSQPSALIVRKGDKVILRVEGMKHV